MAYETGKVWNRGIPCKILKLQIRSYLFCLLVYCSTKCIKTVIRGKIFCDWMNLLAYEADISWCSRMPCISFKTLIQLYLLHSFLFPLNYCIKEVIKGKIFWRLNLKVLANKSATAWNRGIPCNFSKHWSNLLPPPLFLTYFIKEGIKDNNFVQ